MARTRISRLAWACGLGALLVAAGALGPVRGESEKPAGEAVKAGQVPEVKTLLANLAVEKPRTHKNMVVFPIRWSGKQAPGEWSTLDEAVAAGALKVAELDQASVPEVRVENTGDKSVLLMSGEIIAGGKQTRVIRKDTIVEPRQKVAVAVFCVEQHRWAGGKEFKGARNMAPASIQEGLKRGAGQAEVWGAVRGAARAVGAESRTESLDEVIQSDKVQKDFKAAHEDLGKFSPPDTIGIAVADSRTGRVVGLELFGRRDLFEHLQEKLVEGYTLDLVVTGGGGEEKARQVTEKDVETFIGKLLEGTSRYEPTSGSGRGLDLTSGTVHGKGVALGDIAIHLSIQDLGASVRPARPIVDDRPVPVPPRLRE